MPRGWGTCALLAIADRGCPLPTGTHLQARLLELDKLAALCLHRGCRHPLAAVWLPLRLNGHKRPGKESSTGMLLVLVCCLVLLSSVCLTSMGVHLQAYADAPSNNRTPPSDVPGGLHLPRTSWYSSLPPSSSV